MTSARNVLVASLGQIEIVLSPPCRRRLDKPALSGCVVVSAPRSLSSGSRPVGTGDAQEALILERLP
jgi:hypothetical protein